MTTTTDRGKLISAGGSWLLENRATSSDYVRGRIPKTKKVKGRKVTKGYRDILEPSPELKKLQREILEQLRTYGIGVHNAAHAYRANRGIYSMAERHVGKKKVIRIDLADFFDTVTPVMVLGNLPKTVPTQLRKLVENWCFLDDKLPQGAPSSPLLSNVAFFATDVKIQSFVRNWRRRKSPAEELKPQVNDRASAVAYTRYSDDLVFSSNYVHLNHIIPLICSIIRKSGFVVNRKKVRKADARKERQYVTGIVVNEKMSAPKDLRRRIRTDLHRMIRDVVTDKCPPLHQINQQGEIIPLNPGKVEYPFAKIQGEVRFVESVCPSQAEPLLRRLDVLVDVHTKPSPEWSDETSVYVNKCQRKSS